MARPSGKTPIQNITNFSVKKWFVKAFANFIERLAEDYQERNEVLEGGIVTEGASIAAGDLNLDVTACKVMLNGRLKAALAADDDVDYLAEAGDVSQPIFADGATAAALSLSTDETAYCTLIACNTDGSGDVDDDDNGSAKYVIIVAGDGDTYENATAFLTSREIQDALEASTSVHDGVTAWVHIAEILFDENSASPEITVTMNRNNVVSQT